MKGRKAKVSSISEMIEKIDWLMIQPGRTISKIAPDAVAIGFQPRDKRKPDVVDRVLIKIGPEVLAKVKWDFGDKITVLHDPDDLMSFYLTKSAAGKGFTLGKESGSIYGRLQFGWDRILKIEARKCDPVKYHLHKGAIVIFRVGSQDEDA